MNSGKNTPRLLGAAFLAVLFLTFSELWSLSITSSVSDSLTSISGSLMQLRISILLGLILSACIVVLAVLLYSVLHKQNKIIAQVALGWWILEAITVAIRQISVYALIPLAQDYAISGALGFSHFQTLATVLYDVGRWGYDIHLWFFALGGILWYILFYKTRYIPRFLSIWGIVAVSLVLIASILGGFEIRPLPLVLPNGLFELSIGLWLLIKGIKSNQIES
jgi:hypothetical protein